MQNEHINYENLPGLTKIRNITASDSTFLKQASEIYDISLGQNYIPREELLRYASDPTQFILIGATVDQILLGVMLAYPLDQKTAAEHNDMFQRYNIPLNLQGHTVGLIKSVAVKPEYRHAKIGTKLTEEAMTRLKELSCDFFLAVSWASNRPDSSQKMFEKLGFKNILSVPDYWTQDSVEKRYLCPNCGNPCHCTANFYFRKAD